jgi:hypothetical protein
MASDVLDLHCSIDMVLKSADLVQEHAYMQEAQRELLRDLEAFQEAHRDCASLAQTNEDLAAEVETLKRELEKSHRECMMLVQQNEMLTEIALQRQHEHIVQNPYPNHTSQVENVDELRMELIISKRSHHDLEVEFKSQVARLTAEVVALEGQKVGFRVLIPS